MRPPDPELNLLRTCFRRALPGADQETLSREDLAAVNWSRLLWLARQHGAWPLLSRRLTPEHQRAGCPAEVLTQLAHVAQTTHLRAMEHDREFCLVQDVLDRHGIAALSGEHLADIDLNVRRFAPGAALDFLVAPEALDRAVAALEASGHRCALDFTQLTHRGQRPVRLNVGLGGHPAAGRLHVQAVSFAIGGRRLRRLAPVHALLNHAEPVDEHSLSLRAAWTLVGLSRGHLADGGAVLAAEAAHFGLERRIFPLLAASHRMLDLSVPEEIARLAAETNSAAAATTSAPHPIAASLPQIHNAPFLPTPLAVVTRMLQLAGTGPDDVVCDLGCGDGRIVIAAARDFGARGFGIDCDPVRVAEATANAATTGVSDRTRFIVGDIFAADLSGATVVALFLNATFLPTLRPWLLREAIPGTRVISHDYAFSTWAPERMEIVRVGPRKICPIYLWRVPPRAG